MVQKVLAWIGLKDLFYICRQVCRNESTWKCGGEASRNVSKCPDQTRQDFCVVDIWSWSTFYVRFYTFYHSYNCPNALFTFRVPIWLLSKIDLRWTRLRAHSCVISYMVWQFPVVSWWWWHYVMARVPRWSVVWCPDGAMIRLAPPLPTPTPSLGLQVLAREGQSITRHRGPSDALRYFCATFGWFCAYKEVQKASKPYPVVY